MKKANDRQVGGEHYKGEIQHWDFAASQQFDYFQGQITKYVTRWKKKNGVADLKKAMHFLEKYIELENERTKVNGSIVEVSQKEFEHMLKRPQDYTVKYDLSSYKKPSGMHRPFGYNPEDEE